MNSNTLISEIMTIDPIYLRLGDSIMQVKEIFDQNDFHHIPILDGRDNSLQGIVSKLDLIRFFSKPDAANNKGIDSGTVSDIMTPNPIVLDPDDTVGLAADIFVSNKFHAVPIVEDKKMVGILTSHDLLAFAFQLDSQVKR